MDISDLARTGSLDDPKVREWLDGLDGPGLVAVLQPPSVETRVYRVPSGPRIPAAWSPGEPRPPLADEDPAVMAGIARCAMARWRKDRLYGDFIETETHPSRCGWCDYPAHELQRALEWAQHYARYIVSDDHVWTRDRATYRRATGRAGTYENASWATFAALPAKEQRFLVDRAVEASRANMEPVTASDAPSAPEDARPAPDPAPTDAAPPRPSCAPWCDLPDGHPGDCPEAPAE